MRETNDTATGAPADDPAKPTQPTLANTPGVDGCSTPAPAAAMHTAPTPRTTRVTRTAYGNGARPCHLWCLSLHWTRLCAVCVTSPPASTAPRSTDCIGLKGQAAGKRDRRQRRAQPVAPCARTGLQSMAVAGGTPDEAAGSAPV
eukprot:2230278-Pleurochrysis_carterae.AAC.1